MFVDCIQDPGKAPAAAAAGKAEVADIENLATTPALPEGQVFSEHTCLSCPRGCQLRVVSEGKTLVSCEGNSCKRGYMYAVQEISDPRRYFSTTIPIAGAIMNKIPVKITKPLPKEMLIKAASAIQELRVQAPVKMGDVLLENLLGEEGCNVVACRTFERYEEEKNKYFPEML